VHGRHGDIAIFDFSTWRPFAIFDLFAVIWTTREEYSVVSIIVQNLVTIDVVFDNMEVSMFGENGWKTSIRASKIGFFSDLTP